MDIVLVVHSKTTLLSVIIACICVQFTVTLSSTDCKSNPFDSEQLSCSSINSLKNISEDAAYKVEKLNLYNCIDQRLQRNVLNLLPALYRLEVECHASEPSDTFVIEEGALGNKSNLTSVTMSRNGIVSLPTGLFCSADKLEFLSLSDNRISDGDMFGLGEKCRVPCGQSLKNLHLGNNRLRGIKNDSFLCDLRNVTYLYLGQNAIKFIEANAFANLTKLERLYLRNNSLSSLYESTFVHLLLLKDLDLSHNQLKSVENLFRNLRNLKNLDLKYNKIEHLSTTGAFVNLDMLDNLHLGHNLISVIPDGLFEPLKSLSILFMNNNRLNRLEEKTFSGLAELNYLHLDDNRINFISERTFESVPNLMWLYICNNSITHIPSSLPMPFLMEFHLTNNSIARLSPATFNNMSSLEMLQLDDNDIEVIEDVTFRNLTSLTSLNLAHNKINLIGNDSFRGLYKLQSLRLEHNLLNLSGNIFTQTYYREVHVFNILTSLNSLNLSHNLIDEYHYGWWPHSLKNLNLSHNLIAELHMDGIALVDIKNIDLRHNLLKSIEAYRFPSRTNRIFLSHNYLTNIHHDAFVDNPSLRLLLLDNNRLRSLQLDAPTFDRDIGIVKLRLSKNPWTCDCHLKWLRQVANGEHGSYFIEDAQQLNCLRRYHRNRDAIIQFSEANSLEDFMCKFTKNDTELCLIWQSMNDAICQHECPDECVCYRSANWEIINVDCTKKNLTEVPKRLHPVTLHLFLDHNNITSIKKGDFPYFNIIREIYLNDNGLRFIAAGSFENMDTLLRLYLQSNLLENLSPTLFANVTQLLELDLSYNLLHNLSAELFRPLYSLHTLYLNDNKLKNFPVWTLQSLHSLDSIGLYNNPWSCNCDYTALYTSWMRDYARKLKNTDEIYCLDGQHQKISLIAFNDSMCFNGTTTMVLNNEQVMALTSSLIFLVIVTIVSILIFIYRREMQVLIYSRYGVRLFHNVEDEENKLYDAFLSYSSLDETFVVREFLPGLEGIEHPYKLCLHHRDFPIGAFINESIFDAVDKSRRTILILSQNFVDSEWCRFEFRTAHSQMLQDRRNRVIVIILGKIPNHLDTAMRLYLRTHTYLCWDDKLFWPKLYFALPDKNGEIPAEEEHVL